MFRSPSENPDLVAVAESGDEVTTEKARATDEDQGRAIGARCWREGHREWLAKPMNDF